MLKSLWRNLMAIFGWWDGEPDRPARKPSPTKSEILEADIRRVRRGICLKCRDGFELFPSDRPGAIHGDQIHRWECSYPDELGASVREIRDLYCSADFFVYALRSGAIRHDDVDALLASRSHP